ncbi:MAG TPA: FHA domain-containing protein [Polyangia bacterium]|jgi:pSer/pThr/pTyr-binding forkhead associated (FHA) protein|nr:FHA domain-containing protein [Polyangia bacterium]
MPLRFRILAADRRTATQEPAPSADRVVDVADDLQEIRFGRGAGLEVELPFPALSARHARLVRAGQGDGGAGAGPEQWLLEDLGSTNGTAVDGRRLPPGTGHPLRPGQTFRLAHISLVFEGLAPAGHSDAKAAEGTGTIARRLVSDLFARLDDAEAAQVIVLNGAAAGRVLRLGRRDRPYTVGRAPSCDLAVDADQVSREHAGFTRRWEGVFVHDLGSKNGIDVAGVRVSGTQRLRDGDRVDVGSIELRLDDPEDRYLRSMEAEDGPPAIVSANAAPSVPAKEAPNTGAAGAPDAAAVAPRTRGALLPITTAVVVLVAVAAVIAVLLLTGQ